MFLSVKNISVSIAVLDYLTKHEKDFDNLSTVSPAFKNVVINNLGVQAEIGLLNFTVNQTICLLKTFLVILDRIGI